MITLLLAAGAVTATAAAPTVVTDTRYARGATMAFGRMTVQNNGAVLSKRGFCFSDVNSNPTIADGLSSSIITSGGQIYKMKDLKPATRYYARAYVTTTTGETYYGDVIRFYTIPKGTVTWSYDNGGSAAENDRINSAVQSCVTYWNNLTSISGFHLNVHYGASTPTADCSYGGWMRVGPNASYQKTGTIMHEALHGIGVGTDDCGVWKGTVMRAGNGTGVWLGDRAQEVLRFWDNNTTSTLTGDGTHMWPYGINGANEDNGTDALYTITSLIAQALGEDGLPATTGMRPATPYYAFEQEDDVKYYIKSESETYGLFSSYLVEADGNKLQWMQMTAAEAEANDAAAWYVTFTPDNQYYQIHNAKTGNYITYSFVGMNGIKTVKRTTPAAADNFQLMRSRTDLATADGTRLSDLRGYWVMHPDVTNATPACLAGASTNRVTAQAFNRDNSATAQRWLILTAGEAQQLEQSASGALMETFTAAKTLAEKIFATPHIEVTNGADAAFAEILAQLTETVGKATSAAEIQTCADQVLAACRTFLSGVVVADVNQPFVLTDFLVNPGFDGNTGWTTTGTNNFSCIEFYEKLATAQQIVADMPAGTYSMKVQGFQRPGTNDVTYADYIAGKDNSQVMMWFNNTSLGTQTIRNVMSDRQKTQIQSGAKQLADKSYVPNNMESAHAYFEKGLYDNELKTYIPTAGNLTLIIRGANGSSAYWTIFDNVRLYYYGCATLEEIQQMIDGATQVSTVTEASPSRHSGVYTLQGIKVADTPQDLKAGTYIYDGRKVISITRYLDTSIDR